MISAVPATKPVQPIQKSESPLDTLRVGDDLEARVDSILKSGAARLIVAGTTVDIIASVQLAPGTTVKLSVKQGADGKSVLELTQPVSRATPMQLMAPSGLEPQIGVRLQSVLNSLLAAAAATTAALPSMNSETARAWTDMEVVHDEASHQNLRADGGEPDTQNSIATTERDVELNVGSRLQFDSRATSETSNSGAAGARASARPQAPTPSTGAAAASTNAITLVMPGTTDPLQVVVTRDEDERQARQSGKPTRSVKARFTIDSAAFGPVHALLRQCGNAVSVELWAEHPENAADLMRERDELRAALSEQSIAIDTIEVRVGQPAPIAGATSSMQSECP
jgi:hypothetical protein